MGASIWNPTTSVPVPLPSTLVADAITYVPAGASSVDRTAQSKFRDVVSVFDYGAIGDGTTDDTAALAACYSENPGRRINHGEGFQFKILSALTLEAESEYFGKSAIVAAANSNILTGLFNATNKDGIKVLGLEFDATADSSGAKYGVYFVNCNRLEVDLCNFHDTIQAGIQVDTGADIRITRNRVIDCGRNTGTDNHGIMLVSTSVTLPLEDVFCSENFVVNAYRKGITTYTAVGAVGCRRVTIQANIVLGCGLGGIYTATPAGAVAQTFLIIQGNVARGSYVDIELNNVTNFVVDGNDVGYEGALGFAGIAGDTLIDGVISNNIVHSASVHGISLISAAAQNRNLTISGNVIKNSNTTTAGFGAAVVLSNTIKSIVTGNVIDDTTAKMTHGIVEQGSSDFNVIADNNILTATSAKLTIIGTSSSISSVDAGKFGFGVAVPLTNLHVAGTLAYVPVELTLVNGANQNVALPAKATHVRVVGPTAGFNIGGVAGGIDGRTVVYLNYTNFTMTLNHADGGSTAANQFLLGGGANKNVVQYGVAITFYDGTAARWFAAL